MSFNKVILVGNITADPELKQTTTGLSVTTFSLAVNRPKAKTGEQACDFITVTAWRQQAEFICQYFGKGSAILVCGKLQTREYTDKQGNKRTVTEVVADEVTFVGNKGEQSTAPTQPTSGKVTNNNMPYMPNAYGGTKGEFAEIPDDDDLPF